jgi:hypothetical protein
MATPVGPLSHPAPKGAAFNPLFSTKAVLIFRSIIVAAASCALYALYRKFIVTCSTYDVTARELKLIKCQALLTEAKNRDCTGEEQKSSLAQCVALLATIPPGKDKDEVILLAIKNENMDQSLGKALVQALSSDEAFFEAVECMTSDVARPLLVEAYTSYGDEPIDEANAFHHAEKSLKFAEASTSKRLLENQPLLIETAALIRARDCLLFLKGLDHIHFLCQIIKVSQAAIEWTLPALGEAYQHLSSTDKIRASVEIAKTWVEIDKLDRLNAEIENLNALIKDPEVSITTKDLLSIAQLKKQVLEQPSITTRFDLPPFVDKVKTTDEPIQKTLDIAKAYLETGNTAVDRHNGAFRLNMALTTIKTLPEETEEDRVEKCWWFLGVCNLFQKYDSALEFKQDLLQECVYPIYENLSLESKIMFGDEILTLHVRKKELDKSQTLFGQHLTHIKSLAHPQDQFGAFLCSAGPSNELVLLKGAEALLPKLGGSSIIAAMQLAKRYATIDTAKSLQLIERCESNYKTAWYLMTALITTVALGVLLGAAKLFSVAGLQLRSGSR